MSRSRLKKETIIIFNEEEATADIRTYNGRLLRRLEQISAERPEECKHVRNRKDGSADYLIPKTWIKINPKHILSDEQKNKESRTHAPNGHF